MKNDAGSKKSSQDGRLKVEALQLTGPARLLSAASGEGGLFMVLSGSGMLFWNQGPEGGVGAGPGSVLLLGRRDCDFEPAGGWPAELLGCRFPLEMMTEVQKARLVDGSKGRWSCWGTRCGPTGCTPCWNWRPGPGRSRTAPAGCTCPC